MVDIGRLAGLHTVAAITSMDQPLGCAIGKALEMAEAIANLRGEGPEDVSELCYHEATELLVMTGAVHTMVDAEMRVEQAIHSGEAVTKLAEVIAAQGGDPPPAKCCDHGLNSAGTPASCRSTRERL